jgi:phosphinothricin acetyltransferase
VAIFNHYVRTSAAIYINREADTEAWRASWAIRDPVRHPAIVATRGYQIVGFGTLSPYATRCGYAATVENSLYVAPHHVGRGVGRLLLSDLLRRATAGGHHTVIALIDAEQLPSLRLHETSGFMEAGRLREVGRKFDAWRDVVLMQKLLEAVAASDAER